MPFNSITNALAKERSCMFEILILFTICIHLSDKHKVEYPKRGKGMLLLHFNLFSDPFFQSWALMYVLNKEALPVIVNIGLDCGKKNDTPL
jgi:hypothetical protein